MEAFFLLDQPLDPTSKGLLAAFSVIMILMFIVRPFFKKNKDPLARPPVFGSLAQQRSVERQMQNILVELSEMARQITAQLDTRAAKLEALIKDADERINALKSAAQNSHGTPAGTTDSTFREDRRTRESSAQEPARQDSSREDRPTPEIIFDPAPPVDSRHLQIYELADQGRTSREIAQQLNRPSGEIELILALRR